MANHRMFSNRIANSAKFLQMPTESQLLYFHMVLRADDDGVVESYPLIKMLGVAPDVFKVLIAKEFIRQLNEDQVVVIPDWLEHNTIRADRKVNSIYHELLKEKAPDIQLITPKPRTDVEDNSKRLGGQSTVSVSQVKLSQVKLSKSNKDTHGEFKKVTLTHDEYNKLITRIGERNTAILIAELDGYIESLGKKGENKYQSHYATILNWARRRALEHQSKLQTKQKQFII